MSTGSVTSSSAPESSMRMRVAVSLAALTLFFILIQSSVLLLMLNRKEDEFIDAQLAAQIEYSIDVWRKSPGAAFPNAPDMWLYRIAYGEKGDDVPLGFASLEVGNHEVSIGSKEYHVAVREEDGARYILAYDVKDHDVRLDELLIITFASSATLGLLTLIAGYLLAGRLTSRLQGLARRVEEESPGLLCEPGMERELRAVAEALDSYRARQARMLERERAFAENLSHELRTPLTGIRTDAELLASLPDLPAAVARRGNRIISSVDRINDLAKSLLLLARDARPVMIEEISLKMALLTIWDAVLLAQPKPVLLRLEIPDEATVNSDPALLDLVLRNVLENALRYSDAGEIVCTLHAGCLTVKDSGPGFAEADLERVFDRYFIGARGGNGLGLALVRHICMASGWQVSVANAPAGGGELHIDFAAGSPQH